MKLAFTVNEHERLYVVYGLSMAMKSFPARHTRVSREFPESVLDSRWTHYFLKSWHQEFGVWFRITPNLGVCSPRRKEKEKLRAALRSELTCPFEVSLSSEYFCAGFLDINQFKRLTQIACSNMAIVGISSSWVPTSSLRGGCASPLALKKAIAHLDV